MRFFQLGLWLKCSGLALFTLLPIGCMNGGDTESDTGPEPQVIYDSLMKANEIPTGNYMLRHDSASIDSNGFVVAPKYGTDIKPSVAVVYWEKRWNNEEGDNQFMLSMIDSCNYSVFRCPVPWADSRSNVGETRQVMPGGSFIQYFVGWTGTKTILWNDSDATKSFLFPIDSEGDAVYWAGELSYWSTKSLIRKTDSGYILITERTDSMCHPYRRVKVMIAMDAKGNTKEIARKTVEDYPDRCMVI